MHECGANTSVFRYATGAAPERSGAIGNAAERIHDLPLDMFRLVTGMAFARSAPLLFGRPVTPRAGRRDPIPGTTP
jgi:hypothetical protein